MDHLSLFMALIDIRIVLVMNNYRTKKFYQKFIIGVI